MQRQVVVVGAIAAFLGGFAWALRGSWVLVTGAPPSLVLGIGPVFFLVALCGLVAVVPKATLQLHVAIVITTIATVCFITATALHFGAEQATAEGFLRGLATLLMVLALIVVGRPIKRQQAFPRPWHHLPFWLGVLLFPFFLIFAILGGRFDEDTADRLLEVPVILFGIGWLLVASQMVRKLTQEVPSLDGPDPPL